jgi:hypothetical protein
MNKTKLVLVGTIIAGLCFASFVYALTGLLWTQNPEVPMGSFIAYRSDGVTIIAENSSQTDMWIWNGATSSFNSTVIIKNNGQSTINVLVGHSGLNPEWTANGFGSQTAIAVNGTRIVNLSINKTSAYSGEFVGLFTVGLAIVP